MAIVYVAKSNNLSEWGSEVGLSKNLYKLGIVPDGEDVDALLNEGVCAGQSDWKVLRTQDAGDLDEATAIARVAAKEKVVDPTYYPRIKGAQGVIRVKPDNVENSMLIQRALEGVTDRGVKVKPADVADYLIRHALK